MQRSAWRAIRCNLEGSRAPLDVPDSAFKACGAGVICSSYQGRTGDFGITPLCARLGLKLDLFMVPHQFLPAPKDKTACQRVLLEFSPRRFRLHKPVRRDFI